MRLSYLFIPLLMLMVSISYAEDNKDLCPGPGNYRILSEDGTICFPFEIFHGDIRFRGEVNGKEVYLLLDDGFMWDQLLFWGSPRVDSLGFEYDGEIGVGGSNDPDAIKSRTASGITVCFPGVEFSDQTAIITPYSSGVSNMWAGSVGQISATFFKHFVVDINIDKMTITLIEPEKFEYHGGGVEVPLIPFGKGPSMIPASLELADGRTIAIDLFLDLGYNDQLQLATTGEHRIPVPEKALSTSLGRNIQGVATMGYVGRLPGIDIGGLKISDVLVAYIGEEHSSHAVSEAMIGLGLLSRFNIVYDYPHQRMFLEPNGSFSEPFEYDMSGMTVGKASGGDYLEITYVHDNSPASESGLMAGDRITKINGRNASQYDFWSLRPLLQRAGQTLTLVVLRNDEEETLAITLRRLI